MDELKTLEDIESLDSIVMFGKNVLLENLGDANYWYDLLSEDEKKEYSEYPIMHLFERLKGIKNGTNK